MKKQMQKAFSVVLAAVLIFSQISVSFAKDTTQVKKIQVPEVNKEAFAYLRPDVKIKMDGKVYVFFDANGKNVYPIIYGNRTYLPLRGVSAMLDKNIAWESSNKTIYIGKTLEEPYSEKKIKKIGVMNEAMEIDTGRYIRPFENRQITVNVRNDIRVLYNFEEKLTQDGEYYSLNYNWTIYLPIRAVSEMLGLKIDWDSVESTVEINGKNQNEGDASGKQETQNSTGGASKDELEKEKLLEKERKEQFKKIAESEIRELDELHKRATENLVALRRETNEDTQKMYAEAVAQICESVELQKNSGELYKKTEGSESEKALIEGIKDYNEMLYHYTLIMENIAYLAAAGQDFSMLSETFVEFAVQTQIKRQKAGTLLEGMK